MNATHAPRVSIIIPTFNAERFITGTLRSVFEQSYTDYEVIVVDDGSTDDTKAVVLALDGRVRYLYQRNRGPSAARNTGIGVARGEVICFLDADDSWTPNKLKAQLEFMDRNPDVGLAFSDEEEFDESGVLCTSLLSKSRFVDEIGSGSPIKDGFQKLLQENFIPTSTVIVRKECIEKVGLFDLSLKGPEDRDMWSRIAAYFPIACLPEILGKKRAVASSVSRDVETTLRSRILLWSKARNLFPDLAPASVVNRLLAATYVELGFLLLGKDKTKEARRAALKGLKISRDPYQWSLGMSLIVFSFAGRPVANAVFRAKRQIFSRVSTRVFTDRSAS